MGLIEGLASRVIQRREKERRKEGRGGGEEKGRGRRGGGEGGRGGGGGGSPAPMPMPEQQPGCEPELGSNAVRPSKASPRPASDIGNRQHRPAADQIDLPADPRTKHRRDHQRGGERGKDPVRGNAEIARDRIGQDRRQIVTGCPRQRLRGAERQNDRKLALRSWLICHCSCFS